MFNYSYDVSGADKIEGPLIVIPNHSCAWDPLLVGIAFRKKQMYFVASEHVLRIRFAGPIINWLLEPIPRKKAQAGTGTVKACIRHLKAGHSVALFAEGEQTWNGISGKVFPATGKLVKQSGATLVTYRIEGAYLALPRWARGVRKGKVTGKVVNIYTPDVINRMTPDEILNAIDKDIHFDIWKWQDELTEGRISFKGKNLAQGLDKALFMCPSCRSIGTLHTHADSISCDCGFRSRFMETGFLEDGSSMMSTIAEWDAWQTKEFKKILNKLEEDSGRADSTVSVMRDGSGELSRVENGHKDILITTGILEAKLTEEGFAMSVGDVQFSMKDIKMMAMVLSSILLLQTEEGYYQIRISDTNLRKYLQLWQYCSK